MQDFFSDFECSSSTKEGLRESIGRSQTDSLSHRQTYLDNQYKDLEALDGKIDSEEYTSKEKKDILNIEREERERTGAKSMMLNLMNRR